MGSITILYILANIAYVRFILFIYSRLPISNELY